MLSLLLLLTIVKLCGSTPDAPPPERIIPGAIIEGVGKLLPVINYVEIEISLRPLASIASIAATQVTGIEKMKATIRKEHLDSTHENTLLDLLDLAYADLKPLAPLPTPNQQMSHRPRRGLINIVGQAAKFLFGVATEHDLEVHYKGYEDSQRSIKHSIKTLITNFNKVGKTVNQLINITNDLTDNLTNLSQAVNTEIKFSLMLAKTTLYQSRVQRFADQMHTLVDELTLAAKGTVTPGLIPLPALTEFLHLIHNTTHLLPLLSVGIAPLFYSHLTSHITPKGLSVLIPLYPDVTYEVFKLHPFPFMTNNSAFILRPPAEIILRSIPHRLVSLIDSHVLDSCTDLTPGVITCNDLSLPERSFFNSPCPLALLTNHDIQNSCPFDEIPVTPSYPYTVTLKLTTYVFFFTRTLVSTTCASTHNDNFIDGSYRISRSCQLVSEFLTLRPSHHFHYSHELATPQLEAAPLNLTTISLGNMTVRRLEPVPILALNLDSINLIHTRTAIGFPILTAVVACALCVLAFLIFRSQRLRAACAKMERARVTDQPQNQPPSASST